MTLRLQIIRQAEVGPLDSFRVVLGARLEIEPGPLGILLVE